MKEHIKEIIEMIYRAWERKRNCNPKFFDSLINVFQFLFTLLSTFLPSVVDNNLVTGFLILVLFSLIHMSKYVAMRTEYEEEIKKYINENKQQFLCSAKFAHEMVHDIKYSIAKMPYQSIEITRQSVANILVNVLNLLEQDLSEFYKHEICASVKLCLGPRTLKTFARGSKNIVCRGGFVNVTMQNKKNISISDNYAYDLIIKENLQFFASGNLLTLKDKRGMKFYCEYGCEWSDLFISTVIIPIRCPIKSKSRMIYEVLGLICIDSKEEHKEWDNNKENYAYAVTSFVADALYGLISSYIEEQRNREANKARIDKSD